jgi:hypothetical protein
MRYVSTSLLMAMIITAQLSCVRRPSSESASASPSPDEQAVIEQILTRCEQAHGGKEALNAIKSYKLKGTFELAGFKGTIEGWRKEPHKTLNVMEFPQLGTLRKGFDGETNWLETPVGTFSADSKSWEVAKLERDAEVYLPGKIRGLFETMKLEHNVRLSGREVHLIEGKPAKGPAEKLYFDVENGLLVRWDMARKEANGTTVFVRVHLNDYKDVNGVKVPFTVRFAFESFNFIIRLESMEANVPISDAIFRKPY